ncbi:polyprenyl synthetase family protein [Actinokineospora guangxiensis]|uniref:Polyprenyl synthetase family protein n=1 Tax=Actinokineospora guangxiensis TaxID=1490288 RepID=A0ABW0EUW8_9PSEU
MSVLDLVCGHRGAPEVVGWARALIEPGTRAAVDTLPTGIRRVVGYHLGWWDEAGNAEDAACGKGVRPALVLAAAGGSVTAVPSALAVELAHNHFRVLDDLFDGDRARRGRPAAWAVFGRSAATLAANAMLALAYDAVAGDAAASRLLSGAVVAGQEGQAADLAFERRADVTFAEGVAAAEHKTGALIAASVAMGAPGLRRFGERVGLAYQLVDDVLGIWGDPHATGKPVYADLDRGKKTLPVLAALASGTPAARELATAYHGRVLTAADVVHVADLVERAGGRAHCLRQADELLGAALADLRAADLPAAATAELSALAHYAVHRDR